MLERINTALVKQRAAELSVDSGFKQVLAVVKEGILAEWALSHPNAKDAREELYFELQAIGRVERAIAALVDSKMLDARKEAKPKNAAQ